MYLKAAQRAISQFVTVLVLCCSGIIPIQAAQAQDMPQLCVADYVQPELTALSAYVVGVAIYPGHGTTREDLMRAADEAMYEVKNAGKHDVVVAPYPDPSSPPDPNSQSKAD